MFKSPFSFSGYIEIREFRISMAIYIVYCVILDLVTGNGLFIFGIAWLPAGWFLFAQGAKRCHAISKSGWYQIIPFYVFWLLFEESKDAENVNDAV